MLLSDLFVYLDDVQYTKRDWRNRNQLKSPEGARYITVPVQKTSRETLINEALIFYGSHWERRILEQITQWYRKAPNYDSVVALLKSVLSEKHEKLASLNVRLNLKILEYMGLKSTICFSSDVPNTARDKNERLIEICRYFGADLMYDGKSGQNFVDVERFKQHGIDVVFQDYVHRPYPQLWGEFLPYMSILDLLFNVSGGYRETIVTTDLSRTRIC